jgi:streptogramin lyase
MKTFKDGVFTPKRACFPLGLFTSVLFGLIGLTGCGGGGGGDSAVNTPTVPPPPVAASGISLFAGALGGVGSADGTPGRLNFPVALTVDSKGAVFVADRFNCNIRKIVGTTLSTFFGGGSCNGVTINDARLYLGNTVLVSRADDLYFSDRSSIFKIAPDGTVSPTPVASTASAAASYNFSSFAFDAAGTIFFINQNDSGIYQLGAGNVPILVAGGGPLASLSNPDSYADGTGAAAKFKYPTGITVASDGVIYVADTQNHAIRKVTRAGVVTTLAGSPFSRGSIDSAVATAQFDQPTSIAVDGIGNVYVADSANYTIRKITPAGIVTTLAGLPGVRGARDGIGAAAQFNDVSSIGVDKSGFVFVADSGNSVVRRISPEGSVSTIAGVLRSRGAVDGAGAVARFSSPAQIAIDTTDSIYVADTNNATIRKISSAGVVTTLAGTPGISGGLDGPGTTASFSSPFGIAIDSLGNSFVSEGLAERRIRGISSSGQVSTVKSFGPIAPGGSLRSSLSSIALDNARNIFYVENISLSFNPPSSTLGKLTPTGAVGSVSCGPTCKPLAVTADNLGNVYIATIGTIKRIAPDGAVSNLAGDPAVERFGSTDGTGAEALFNAPLGLATDNKGNIFVADSGNHTVRKITAAGVVTTIAGKAGVSGVVMGSLPGLLNGPRGIVVDSVGAIFVTTEDAVVKIVP